MGRNTAASQLDEYQLLAKSVSYQLGEELSDKQIDSIQKTINQLPCLIELAEVHGVAPFFYQFIKQHNIEAQAEIKHQLQSLILRHKFAAEARVKVLGKVISVFKQNNVELVLLKGVALAHMIYPQPLYRPMRDIDILVSKSDVARVKGLLEGLDFMFDQSYASIYMRDIHHLPNATKQQDGLQISLEVHHQIYSRDVKGSQNFEQIIEHAQSINLADQVKALTLDHLSMLNHLCRHTFSLAPEVRLIHQHDIVKYIESYINEISWDKLQAHYPFIINTVRCLYYSIYLPEVIRQKIDTPRVQTLVGVGEAMLPYTHILAKKKNVISRFKALFCPSPWWMHVYYNVAPDKSLIWCYLFYHPQKVVKDIMLRLFDAGKTKLART